MLPVFRWFDRPGTSLGIRGR